MTTPQRIVSFLPSATEMVCALGLEDRLAGITHECDYPASVRRKPIVVRSAVAVETMTQAEIDKAVAQGIPVICVDSDVPSSNRVLYIGTDNFKAGRESLKRMATLLASKGNIAVITISGQRNVDDRVAGVADALKNFPALKLTKILDDKGDARRAFDQISELIQKKEKIDGIICLEATGGSGAAGAVHRFSMDGKMPIVAFDNDPETLDWIDRGVITATITQKPYVMSYYGLKFLDDLHHNAVHQFKDWRTALAPPMPTSVDTGTVIVDKNNLKVYREAAGVDWVQLESPHSVDEIRLARATVEGYFVGTHNAP